MELVHRFLYSSEHTQMDLMDQQTSPAMMCCDVNGLCVKKIGSDDLQPSHSGSYTAIIRLASKLSGISSQTTESSSESTPSKPVTVTIETDQSSTVAKRYGQHTVVIKVPASKAINENDEDIEGSEAETGQPNS